MGFGVPIDAWLRGPLREWGEELLRQKALDEQGLLDADQVLKKWQEHLSGKRNWQYLLWDVLVLQQWLQGGSAPLQRARAASEAAFVRTAAN